MCLPSCNSLQFVTSHNRVLNGYSDNYGAENFAAALPCTFLGFMLIAVQSFELLF